MHFVRDPQRAAGDIAVQDWVHPANGARHFTAELSRAIRCVVFEHGSLQAQAPSAPSVSPW